MKGSIIYYPVLPDLSEPGADKADDLRVWLDFNLVPEGRASYNEKECNAYLVAAGDGGLMRAARNLYRSGKVIFGVNRGTFGFLLNEVKDPKELPADFSALKTVNLRFLRSVFYRRDGKIKRFLAFNDVFCGGEVSDHIEFTIRGTLRDFPDRVVYGNGVAVSTPQGTTAYALKNCGSSAVLPLDSRAWFISGMSTGPYPCDVVSPQRIEIAVKSRTRVNGYADGKTQTAADIKKIVVMPTTLKVTLGFLRDRDFQAKRRLLAQKVERGER